MSKKQNKKTKFILEDIDIEKINELAKENSIIVLKIKNFGTLNIGKPKFMDSDDESSEDEDLIEIPIKKEKKQSKHKKEKKHKHKKEKKEEVKTEKPKTEEIKKEVKTEEPKKEEIKKEEPIKKNVSLGKPKHEEENESKTFEENFEECRKEMKRLRELKKQQQQKNEEIPQDKNTPKTEEKNVKKTTEIPQQPQPRPSTKKGIKIEEVDDDGNILSECEKLDGDKVEIPSNFANSTHNPQIDIKLAQGYMLVNNGKLQEAVIYLTQFLQEYPTAHGGYIARGTAFAMAGQFQQAVEDFDRALMIDNKNHDALKRKGQTLIALGRINEALDCFNKAVKYCKTDDFDVYKQRGICHQIMKNYEKGRDDFAVCVKKQPGDHNSWNHYGLNNTALGLFVEAADAFGRAISIRPDFIESYVNLAQLQKDAGQPKKSLDVFKMIFKKAPNHCFAHYLKGVLYQQVGYHIEATKEFKISTDCRNDKEFGLQEESDKLIDLYRYYGITLSASGRFREAIKVFDQAIEMRCDDSSWYMKEVALYTHHLLDKPFNEWNVDVFDPLFKEGFCKRLIPAALHKYEEQKPFNNEIKDIEFSDLPPEDVIEKILKPAMEIGKYMQYDSQGFVHNASQYLMGGLAAIQIGKLLRKEIPHWKTGGLSEEEAKKYLEIVPWRKIMEISTKWRQISEPNDPVFWIDGLTPEQFEEGFGSHTPMYTGQGRVIRYFCQYDRAFKIVQKLLPKQVPLKPEWAKVVREAKNIDDILKVMETNFQVTTPCRSDNFDDPKTKERKVYEGTNLVTEIKKPFGYDFAIKTPCKKSRWHLYDKELEACWKKIILNVLTRRENNKEDEEKILRSMYSFTFFWYNFMPLTRGTAAGGFVFMMSILASLGKQIGKNIPKGMQTDWEAILCEYPQHFGDVMYEWMKDSIINLDIDSIPYIEEEIPTTRDIIICFNYCPRIHHEYL